jgi:hypothetical protein
MTVDFKRFRRTSFFRLGLVSLALLAWVAGVSVLVSELSPLDELVKTSPIDEKNLQRSIETLQKLNRQSTEADRILYRLEYISEQFSKRSEEIIKLIDAGSFDDAYKVLSFIAHKSDINKISLPNASYQSFHFLDVTLDSRPLEDATYLRSASIAVCGLDLAVVPVKIQEDGNDKAQLDPISFLYSGYDAEEYKYNNTCNTVSEVVGVGTNQKVRFEWYYEVTEKAAFLLGIYGSDGIRRAGQDINFPDQLQSLRADFGAVLKKVIDDNIAAFDRDVTRLKALRDEFTERSAELEGRLNSSSELFAVAAFRATLITAIAVSIGFVLLRSFAAEIYQARRLSEIEVAHMLAESLEVEKLSQVPELAKAIAGRQTKTTASVPEDVINAAGKLGEVVSRFSSKSTGKS